MKDYKLIAFDLDGTIIRQSGRMSKPDLRALEAAARNGCRLAAVTGRPFSVVPSVLKELPAVHRIAASSGGEIWDRQTDGWICHAIAPETAVQVARLAEARGVGFLASFRGAQVMDRRMVPVSFRLLGRRKGLRDRLSLLVMILWQSLKIPKEDEISARLAAGREAIVKLEVFTERGDVLRDLLRETEALPGLTVVETGGFGLEITAEGANKGAAIAEICRAEGIAREQVIAFGDGENDLPMRTAAGTLAAMGNACPELKAVADFTAPPVWKNGVAKTLEWLGLTK